MYFIFTSHRNTIKNPTTYLFRIKQSPMPYPPLILSSVYNDIIVLEKSVF